MPCESCQTITTPQPSHFCFGPSSRSSQSYNKFTHTSNDETTRGKSVFVLGRTTTAERRRNSKHASGHRPILNMQIFGKEAMRSFTARTFVYCTIDPVLGQPVSSQASALLPFVSSRTQSLFQGSCNCFLLV